MFNMNHSDGLLASEFWCSYSSIRKFSLKIQRAVICRTHSKETIISHPLLIFFLGVDLVTVNSTNWSQRVKLKNTSKNISTRGEKIWVDAWSCDWTVSIVYSLEIISLFDSLSFCYYLESLWTLTGHSFSH